MATIQRPFGVSLLAVLHVVQAIFLFIVGFWLMALRALAPRIVYIPRLLGGLLWVIGTIVFVIAILDLGFAYGIWKGRGWAWVLSLIFAVLGIIGSLISLIRGGLGPVVTLIIDVIVIFYLTRPNVKAFFGEGKPKA